MPIPKTIFQTFRTSDLPALTRWHIQRLRKKNPDYDYQFYDDARVDSFVKQEFDKDTYELIKRINIGAARADFFRYAILYKKGGIYLDIDSLILRRLDDFIYSGDRAIISLENNLQHYIQYALFFEPGHPFLKRTLELLIQNLRENKFPYDVHKMTGPTVYSRAIRETLRESPDVRYREFGIDYEGNVKFSHRMSKFFLYGISRKNHWKTQMKTITVLSDVAA